MSIPQGGRNPAPAGRQAHSRADILALDLGNWTYARGAVIAQNAERIQYLDFHRTFRRFDVRMHPHAFEQEHRVGVEPIFCWEVRVERDLGDDGWVVYDVDTSGVKPTTRWRAPEVRTWKITHETAQWLVRGAGDDVRRWMVRQMAEAIDVLDEAWLDCDTGMPTIGGVDVAISVREVERTESLLRNASRELQLAIEQLSS